MAAVESCSTFLSTFEFNPNDNEFLNALAQSKKPITNITIDDSLLIDLKDLSIDGKICEGSSSTVYEGRYQTMPVAIKLIHLQLQDPESSIERRESFAREVMMLSRVKHDKLVPFIGASMEPNLLIVTGLMKGGSLKKYLWNMRPACPDLQQSISFALDISRAMERLHAHGIIHRDLKPANLLLTEDHRSLKVADFGLAREEIAEEMTSEAGTYRWMAPELFSTVPLERDGKKYYDRKVDIYSFAIVLWELLTNTTPFKGMSCIQAAYAVAMKHRPSLNNLPEHLVRLLESCWAEDPAIRPDFNEITAYLLDILNPKLNEESTIQLQVADSHGTSCLMDENSTQLQVADSHVIHHPMNENPTQLQVADSSGTDHLMDVKSTQLKVADSPGPHHPMNEKSTPSPVANSPGTRCLIDEKSRTELVEGKKSGKGFFSYVLSLCRRGEVRKKKSGNGLFSCMFGPCMRRDVRGKKGIAKPFTICAS